METSAYLYLDESRVQMDKAQDHYGGASGKEGSKFLSVDLGTPLPPMRMVQWTSSATPTGVSGAPTLSTKEKGRVIVEAAAQNFLAFVRELRAMEKGKRVDHRVVKPSLPTYPSPD
jgi:creatinine amidohydrolase/Fe(II)-dependent formamide hydrolase-like protein